MKDTNNQGKSFQERLAEAEERRKNETISDIIAAKRREADSIEASARGSFKAGEDWDEMPFTESDLKSAFDLAETKRKEADRLEAAIKRERGDAAKLREALVQAELFVGNIVRHGHQTLVPGDKCTACDGAEELRDMICAALSAPPRNCDRFATVDEARKAHEEYRGDYIMRASNKFDFPMEFEAWLFALATEKEGGANA